MKISLQSHRTHIKKQCTPVIPAWVERETRGPWDQLQAQWEILSQKHEVEEQLGAEGKSIWCTAWWLESEPQTPQQEKMTSESCPLSSQACGGTHKHTFKYKRVKKSNQKRHSSSTSGLHVCAQTHTIQSNFKRVWQHKPVFPVGVGNKDRLGRVKFQGLHREFEARLAYMRNNF